MDVPLLYRKIMPAGSAALRSGPGFFYSYPVQKAEKRNIIKIILGNNLQTEENHDRIN